jgi:lipoprotein-anchoring transpeptidase ErfK/SrfK
MSEVRKVKETALVSRRSLLAGLLGATTLSVAGCQSVPEPTITEPPADYDDSWYIGSLPDQPYDIPLVDRTRMKPELMRQVVSYTGGEKPGTIVVNIDERFLYLVQADNTALRYGIGVGRQGFSWRGVAEVGRKGVWPEWRPTSTMKRVLKGLPEHMAGGVDSPLGARALYLYQNGHDILFRIHGTNEPWSIGEQVSSGCVRMLNEDIYDLYNRVKTGTIVKVRKGGGWFN